MQSQKEITLYYEYITTTVSTTLVVQLTATHTTTQTKMFVSSRVLYFVRAAGNLSLVFCVSFFFLHIFFTIKNPSSLCVLRIAFPEPFRFDPGDARRSATTTTTDDEYNYVLFRHRSVEASLGRRHVRDADADVRREILVYGCESRRARNAAADHVWYANLRRLRRGGRKTRRKTTTR